MPRTLVALGSTAATLVVFAVFLIAFLTAPLVVLGVFAVALAAATSAGRRS
jgi:hypothetical protein